MAELRGSHLCQESQKRLIVVICGSAASWMIAKVLRHRGGLHNRVTRRVHLHPITLGETEELLRLQGVTWERPQIAELYMATGGIPFYLSLVERGRSAAGERPAAAGVAKIAKPGVTR